MSNGMNIFNMRVQQNTGYPHALYVNDTNGYESEVRRNELEMTIMWLTNALAVLSGTRRYEDMPQNISIS